MVYTVTFNPAIDYVVRMEAFYAGRVNRTSQELVQFGGKGVNVSTVLRNLGVENTALGFVAGFTGSAIEEGLRRAGVHTDFIHLPAGLTRINVKIKAGQETEINGRGPDIRPEDIDALFHRLDRLSAGDYLALAGSIPAALPDDIYEQILKRLEGRGVHTAVDAEGNLLVKVLPYRPFLIKPNHLELGAIFGRELKSDQEIRACAKALQEKGARNVLVSMAGDGAILLDETGAFHKIGVPAGRVKNSVGAGDSMVAGFLAGWFASGDYGRALRMGAAAGSATAFSDGLATRDEVLALMDTF